MRTLAVLSLHTSPLAQPGTGDSGGMNVYVREFVASLAQAGVNCNVYVRKWADDLPETVDVEPGFSVVHVPAGRPDLTKEELEAVVPDFTEWTLDHIRKQGDTDAIHANYWLSGVVGHVIKHELDLPLISTFHTLARVKAETGDPEPDRRVEAESKVIACSDAILANAEAERSQLIKLYGADPDRIEIVPPGVDHAFFSPGDRRGARHALGLGDEPVVLFVGRVQPLKGLDVAISALAELDRPDVTFVVVGGASGLEGERHFAECRALVEKFGLERQVRFTEPQPHHMLSTFYRAADISLVPSRSESFGLVALEAAACGTPVVAADVGGLRTLVQHGETGLRVESRNPADYAAAMRKILEDPSFAERLSTQAATHARSFTWSTSAAKLRRVYNDLTTGALIDCA